MHAKRLTTDCNSTGTSITAQGFNRLLCPESSSEPTILSIPHQRYQYENASGEPRKFIFLRILGHGNSSPKQQASRCPRFFPPRTHPKKIVSFRNSNEPTDESSCGLRHCVALQIDISVRPTFSHLCALCELHFKKYRHLPQLA